VSRSQSCGSISEQRRLPASGRPRTYRQVVSNLLDNARKATGGKGKVDISIGRSGTYVELWVQDSGPGVPEAEREHIFERFVRLNDPKDSNAATAVGSGSRSARGFAEAHGGTLICADSDTGARFVLRLPLSGRGKRNEPSRTARVS